MDNAEIPRSAQRILIIGDDAARRQELGAYFESHGFASEALSGAYQPHQYLHWRDLVAIIVDLPIKQWAGFSLLEELRARSEVPIIITDALRYEEEQVQALEKGADDYLTKPFSNRELHARVRVVLRRHRFQLALACAELPVDRYRFGDWILNCHSRRLSHLSGARITLGNRQYALLVAFLKAPLRPLSREYLIEAMRPAPDLFDRSIDAQVSRLRRKLAIGSDGQSLIQTEHGVGYTFAATVHAIPSTPAVRGS